MKKILPILGLLVLIGIGVFMYTNRLITLSNLYTPETNYSIEISQQAGEVNVQPGSEMETVIKYKGRKPAYAFEKNTLNMNFLGYKINRSAVSLPTDKNLSNLKVNIGSGNIDMSLVKIPVSKVSVNAGSSIVTLSLPGTVSSEIDLVVGSGNINLQIPKNEKLDGVRITPQKGTSLNLPETGWKKVGDSYETINYSKASVKSNISLGVGSVNLNITTID